MHKAVVAHRQLTYPNLLPEGDGAVRVYLCGLLQQPLPVLWNWEPLRALSRASSYCNMQMTLLRGFSCAQTNRRKITLFF